MKVLDHTVTIVLFKVMSVFCICRAEPPGCFTTKESGKDVHMHTTDVTKEFYGSRPHSPLRFSTEFKPLPEAPVNVMFSKIQSHQNTSLRWTQRQGFRSKLLRFYLIKMVKDKETDGVPMRYTRYLLLGPVLKLSGKTATTFNYSCVNLTDTYEVTIKIWALGTMNMTAIHKQFWINKHSGTDVSFRPEYLQKQVSRNEQHTKPSIKHHVKPSSYHHVKHSTYHHVKPATKHDVKHDTDDSKARRVDFNKAQSDQSTPSKRPRKKKKSNRHQNTCR